MPLTPLLPGDPGELGPHRLIGRLGQGGMGTVFLGIDPDERAVAVKVLRAGPSDEQGRRRFRRELEVLRRIHGRHLVQVLGGDVDALTPWIVTRFVPGRRLDEQVHEYGALTGPALRRLADGLAEGLHALHRSGVVHRDLSPGNVLMVDGEPQVIDLGLAVVADVTAFTRTGVLLGTAGYLAPEQVLGEPSTAAVDVHAWGAVVAFAATGRPPYGTGRPEAVLFRLVHDAPDLDGVPAELAPLVARALAKDPARRPTPAELGQALDLLSPPSPSASSDGPRPGAPQPDVTELLGPQATQVLGRHADAVLATDPHPAADPPVGVTARLGAGAPGLVEGPEPVLTTVLGGPPTRVLPLARPAPPAPQDEWPVAEPWAGPEEPPRRSTGQAWVAAVGALGLLAGVAALAPLLAAGAAVLGLLAVQTVARARGARALRLERKGPRTSDGVVAVAQLPWHALRAALDVLVVLPLAVGVGAPVAYVVAQSLPLGQTWLPAQADIDGVQAVGIAAGLVLALTLALLQPRSRPGRLLLRRAATAPAPAAAAAVLLGAAVLAVAAVGLAVGVGVVWSPLGGAPLR